MMVFKDTPKAQTEIKVLTPEQRWLSTLETVVTGGKHVNSLWSDRERLVP